MKTQKQITESVNRLAGSMDAKIYSLPKGGEMILSSANGIVCSVEKSGKGDKLRFIRTSDNGNKIEVFHTVKIMA